MLREQCHVSVLLKLCSAVVMGEREVERKKGPSARRKDVFKVEPFAFLSLTLSL